MTLEACIASWDGRSADDLGEVYAQYHTAPGFGGDLVALLGDARLRPGGSWLLKRYLEAGKGLAAGERRTFFGGLGAVEDWPSRLHLLQCLPYLEIGARERARVEAFVRACLVDPNKFVRAWAYNGFAVLAAQHPAYRPEVDECLRRAEQSEAASVRARVRRIRKEYP